MLATFLVITPLRHHRTSLIKPKYALDCSLRKVDPENFMFAFLEEVNPNNPLPTGLFVS